MTPRELEELLGAYALDAVDDDERREVEAYLAANPRAREEVAAHREVATMLAFTGAPAPPGLWDRISASLEEQPPPAAVGLASVTSINRRRWPARVVAVAAAAAVAAIAVLSAKVVDLNDRVNQSEAAAADPLLAGAMRAMRDPTSKLTTLTSSDRRYTMTAVITADGTGYVVPHTVPPAAAGHTYQLWAVTRKATISLGVLGREPALASFHVDGPIAALAVTEEEGQGVAVTQNTPVMVGPLV